MNPYMVLSSNVGTVDAMALSARLSAWHDAMVAHERRLRTTSAAEACHDDCPHVEARRLWPEALATFGDSARALTFLRSRGQGVRPSTGAPISSEATP